MVLFFLQLGVVQAQETAIESPIEVIEVTATALQKELTGRKAYFEEHQAELYAVIDRVLLPHFDIQYAGKQVLGKTHWMASTDAQHKAFIDVFYNFLVKTYAKGILEFDQDRMSILPDLSYSKNRRKALVTTRLLLEGGDSVLIKYALREVSTVWKIYDVRIDGVSYIQNYRNQFDAEINALGIDAVIDRLEKEAIAPAVVTPADT
ncbi:MAG: ABC transporter substrate-binding protein [Gammaproteobacteria bacterium]|nr:ABC transporter substrate-binding protein [Gammaproteobacteria bacterium]